MDPVMLVLRFFHIVAGVLWVGMVFLFAVYVGPSAAEVAPSSGPFLSTLVKKRRVGTTITVLVVTTLVAGWLMWILDVGDYGSVGAFIGTPFGLALTIGGVLATIAGYLGITGVAWNVERLVDLGDTVRASGGPPTAEQSAALGDLGARIARNGRIVVPLLILSVIAMATARYW